MSGGSSALDEIRDRLRESHPGWAIWWAVRGPGNVTWYARPHPLLAAPDPESLAAGIELAAKEHGLPG